MELILVALGEVARGVEVDEVNGFVRDVVTENVESVAVIELVPPAMDVARRSSGGEEDLTAQLLTRLPPQPVLQPQLPHHEQRFLHGVVGTHAHSATGDDQIAS